MATSRAIGRRNILQGFSCGIGSAALMGTTAMAQAKQENAVQTPPSTPNRYGMRFVDVRGVTWAYRDKGIGRPALFLHSFLLNSNLWSDQIDGLSDVRRCIAPDLRGWGQSEPVGDNILDPYQYAADVVEFLDNIGVDEPVDIVALSVGAFIAGLVYELAPEKVSSLTLISATFKFKRNLAYERYQQEMARLVVVEGKDALFRRFDEYIDGPDTPLFVRARYKQMLLDSRTEMIVAYLNGSGTTPERPDLPGKIRVPVLLPIGSDDSVFSLSRVDDMAKDYPDATTQEVEGAGRLIPIERPKGLNDTLREFWAKNEG